jgi:DNA-binding transcriptional regulator YdaS (Cro superfamily)
MNEETKRAPSDSPQTPEEAIAKAIELAGGARATARHFAITHQVVLRWKIAPAKRARELARLSGVAKEDLRPDLYPREESAEGAPR